MDGMRAPPEIIGRERQYADCATYPIVRQAMPEEGTVAAIVLDHEQPNQESGGRHGEQQGHPPEAKVVRCPGQCPQRHKWHERDGNLDDTSGVTGFSVAFEELHPSPRVFRCGWASSDSAVVQDQIHGWVAGDGDSDFAKTRINPANTAFRCREPCDVWRNLRKSIYSTKFASRVLLCF